MKHLPLKSTMAFVTFVIGVGITAFWFTNTINFISDVDLETPVCHPRYSENFNASDYESVVTRDVYLRDADGKRNLVSENKAKAETTKNLFTVFREMPLSKMPQCVDESYRLTWLPTFHAPTVIHVWRSGGEFFITTKRLNGRGGYDFGELEIEETHSLTVDDWESFEIPILQDSFWKMPGSIKEESIHDGASWTLEGFSNGKYHSVYRTLPSKQLNHIFRKIFDLTGVKTEYEDYLPLNPQ